jgi:hypothetical protein
MKASLKKNTEKKDGLRKWLQWIKGGMHTEFWWGNLIELIHEGCDDSILHLVRYHNVTTCLSSSMPKGFAVFGILDKVQNPSNL